MKSVCVDQHFMQIMNFLTKSVLARSVYSPGVCANQECVSQECALTRSVC